MSDIKVVIADPKTGKCYQKEVKSDVAVAFLGMKIGQNFKGETIDLAGYEFMITGGSDTAGFPMRKDVAGIRRKKIFAISGVGMKRKDKGVRQRKTVVGNTVSELTAQINVKIIKYGKDSLGPAETQEAKKE